MPPKSIEERRITGNKRRIDDVVSELREWNIEVVKNDGDGDNDDAMCVICQGIALEPTQLPCSHLFCIKCITQVLSIERKCPSCRAEVSSITPILPLKTANLLAYRVIFMKLRVRCPVHVHDGCDWSGAYSDMSDHVSGSCRYIRIRCGACGMAIPRKDQEQHTSVCEQRKSTCIDCGAIMKYDLLPSHIKNECPASIVTCTQAYMHGRKGCGEIMIRKSLAAHRRLHCINREIFCPYARWGCSQRGLALDTISVHLTTNLHHHLRLITEMLERLPIISKKLGRMPEPSPDIPEKIETISSFLPIDNADCVPNKSSLTRRAAASSDDDHNAAAANNTDPARRDEIKVTDIVRRDEIKTESETRTRDSQLLALIPSTLASLVEQSSSIPSTIETKTEAKTQEAIEAKTEAKTQEARERSRDEEEEARIFSTIAWQSELKAEESGHLDSETWLLFPSAMTQDSDDHHVAFLVPIKDSMNIATRRLKVPGDERSRMFPGLCLSDDGRKLWVVGGSFAKIVNGVRVGTILTNSVWCYDTMLDKWHHEPDLPVPVCGCALVSKREELYVFGGTESSEYSPGTQRSWVLLNRNGQKAWKREHDLPYPCESAIGCMLGERVCLVGGKSPTFRSMNVLGSYGWTDIDTVSFDHDCMVALLMNFTLYSVTEHNGLRFMDSDGWKGIGTWHKIDSDSIISARFTQSQRITIITSSFYDGAYTAHHINTVSGDRDSHKLLVARNSETQANGEFEKDN